MKVTKDNAVVGLKVTLDKDSEFRGQDRNAEYGEIIESSNYFPKNQDYLWVLIHWKDKDGKLVGQNYYQIGDNNKFDLNVYQESKDVIPEYVECIKGYNTDLSINDFNVVGKIYEVESYNPKTEELKLKGFSGYISSIKFDGNSKGLSTDYKISTKAEFDLQNQAKVEEKPEVLVFGKFKIGSIVVSLCEAIGYRKEGDMFKILPHSTKNTLYYRTQTNNPSKDDWRQASPEECKAFEQGITNIKDMKFEENLVGRYLKTLVNNPVSIGMDIGEYLLATSFNTDTAVYDVTRVRDNHPGFGIEVSDLLKFAVMPIGFTPESEVKEEQPKQSSEEFKVGDWVVIQPEKLKSSFYDSAKRYSKDVPVKALQIDSIGDNGLDEYKDKFISFSSTMYQHPIDCFRKATPSEIYEAQKLERDKFISQAVEKLEVPYPTRSYKNFKECYTKLPIVTSVKRSNIVPLKLEKQKSLINLPTI